MGKTELISVYIKIEKGRTVCMCPRWKKRCNQPCEKDIVERDPYRGWEETLYRDRYGKSPDRG